MAGSLSWFRYTSDTNTEYAVKADTSNMKAVGGLDAPSGSDSLPRNLKPRYAMYSTNDGLRKRKVILPLLADLAAPPVTLNLAIDGGTAEFKFLYSRGESISRSRPNTGLQV